MRGAWRRTGASKLNNEEESLTPTHRILVKSFEFNNPDPQNIVREYESYKKAKPAVFNKRVTKDILEAYQALAAPLASFNCSRNGTNSS